MDNPSMESRVESLLFGTETPEVEQPEVEQPEAEQTEVEQQDETPEDQEEASQDSPEESPEEFTFSQLSELAEATGQDLESFLDKIKDDVIIGGEKSSVSLKEMKAGYMKDADYRQKTSQLAEAKRAFEEERQSLQQQYQAKFEEADSVLSNLENAYKSQYANIDWQSLRMEDPAEYSAKKAEQQEVERWLMDLRSQTAHNKEQLMQEQAAQRQEQLSQLLARERELLHEKIPDFSPEKSEQIGKYLLDFGFTGQEISQAYDHRIIAMAEKARLYDQLVKNKDIATQKVRTLPKITKPGAATKTNPKTEVKRQIKAIKDPTARAKAITNLIASNIEGL